MIEEKIEELAQELNSARRIAVLSGAGLSAESGIPTFRGDGGLWKDRKATDLATSFAFEREPETVWDFYNWRRKKVLSVEPNPAHFALAKAESHIANFIHITQNVDGLAQRAGGKQVIELHGNLFSTRCNECGEDRPDLAGIVPFPTSCDACGGLVRPGVVWFGEAVGTIDDAVTALRGTDLLIVIGTSAVVHPAASLAMYCKMHGAFVAEINLEATPLSTEVDLSIEGPAGEILPELVKSTFGE